MSQLKRQRLEERLAANIAESERLTEFAGVRFGVLAKLRGLEMERITLEAKLEKLRAQEAP